MAELKQIAVNKIRVHDNYRKTFDEAGLKELSQSIKENGVIEPLIVRHATNRKYFQIVAGERRFRAAKMAGLVAVPAVVRELTDFEFQKFQLIENIQREDVPFMEEAYGILNLREKHALDVEEISKMLGKSQAYVFQALKLTKMSDFAQKIARAGEVSKSVALIISKIPDEENQTQAASDLRRKYKSYWITARTARRYVQEKFGEERISQHHRNGIQKTNGHDYAANWKHYLVNFTPAEFLLFKKICRGRFDHFKTR